jgi:rare lipoprotein A
MFRALISAAPVNLAVLPRAVVSLPLVLGVALLPSCSHSIRTAAPARIGSTETGTASWYGHPYHGRRTASGEIFDMERLTAAHKKLPFQTWVEVTNLNNGKQVRVRITDRGPFVHGRIIDLSLAAARDIDMIRAGTARVRLRVIRAPAAGQLSQSSPEVVTPPSPQAAPAYVVQVGAFSGRDRAEAVSASLPGREVRIVEPRDDSQLWRVVVGHNLSKDAAEALASELRRSGGAGIVVPE